MLYFLLFKSKAFISLLSVYSNQRAKQRKIGILQTITLELCSLTTLKVIHGYSHGEEKDDDGFLLPNEIEVDYTYCEAWNKNGCLHREEKIQTPNGEEKIQTPNGEEKIQTPNGLTLPAVIGSVYGSNYSQWWRYGKLHRDDVDENGIMLPSNTSDRGPTTWYINGIRQKSPL